jgi:hypothetical protein
MTGSREMESDSPSKICGNDRLRVERVLEMKKRAPAMKPELKFRTERLEAARPGKGETQ